MSITNSPADPDTKVEQPMPAIIDYQHLAGDLPRALSAVSARTPGDGFPRRLRILIDLRASQLNGCRFCQDLHTKEAIAEGESIVRIQALAAWRSHDRFTPAECAALNWTELLTRGEQDERKRDDALALLYPHFAEQAICRLTFAIALINAWNRVGVAFHRHAHTNPDPGQHLHLSDGGRPPSLK